jgi:pimeloyl-ACP methyl ester carboxylesterase
VIGGKNDIFTPVWMAEELAGGMQNAELHLYENSGHAFHWEQIEDFNPRVRDWLMSH